MKNLEIVVQDAQGNLIQNYSFGEGNYSIGRIEASDIVVKSPKISREHAEFIVKENQVFIRDKNSKFGTFIDNGTEVKKVSNAEIFQGNIIHISPDIHIQVTGGNSVSYSPTILKTSDIQIQKEYLKKVKKRNAFKNKFSSQMLWAVFVFFCLGRNICQCEL